MNYLVTGAAGFIGMHVVKALLKDNHDVVGVDNLSSYYNVTLKSARIEQLKTSPNFYFHHMDITTEGALNNLVDRHTSIHTIIHLAAQPGVRYSLENPFVYIDANVKGQVAVLEAARRLPHLRQIIYASSSSVYGGNTKLPFSEEDAVDHPVSVYAATKRSCELLADTYAHLYGLALTGLRFFTVYGPWGRPDMAPILFANALTREQPIKLFNHGDLMRDFTFIDDIVAGILGAAALIPVEHNNRRHEIYNLGNHQAEPVTRFINILAQSLDKKPIFEMLPMQPGDVPATFADITKSQKAFGFHPHTPIDIGIPRFVDWYRRHYQV